MSIYKYIPKRNNFVLAILTQFFELVHPLLMYMYGIVFSTSHKVMPIQSRLAFHKRQRRRQDFFRAAAISLGSWMSSEPPCVCLRRLVNTVSRSISKRARLAKPVRTVDITGVTFCANTSPWNFLRIASNRATRKSYYSPCFFFVFFKYVILVHIHIIYRDVCVGGQTQ